MEMETLIFVLIVLGWWASGVAGFVFWWKHQYYYLTDGDYFAAMIIGLFLGPSTWAFGAWFHGDNNLD